MNNTIGSYCRTNSRILVRVSKIRWTVRVMRVFFLIKYSFLCKWKFKNVFDVCFTFLWSTFKCSSTILWNNPPFPFEELTFFKQSGLIVRRIFLWRLLEIVRGSLIDKRVLDVPLILLTSMGDINQSPSVCSSANKVNKKIINKSGWNWSQVALGFFSFGCVWRSIFALINKCSVKEIFGST